MDHAVAVRMIKDGVKGPSPEHWADLGAGDGVFTRALADLLIPQGSIIYAVDTNLSALQKIHDTESNVNISKIPLDFIIDQLPLHDLDGVIMANSLHFVRDKLSLMWRIKKILKPQGKLLIVEYDTLSPSYWVPYPVNFETLEKLMKDMGFARVIKLSEVPSMFNQASIYSALVT